MVGASRAERDLVDRMLSGRQDAFDEFFEQYFPQLYRFALARLGRNEDAAEEVTQEALCKVVRKLHTFRGEASLLAWMCTFCRHEISAWYRLHNREVPESSLAEDADEIRAALDSLAMEVRGPRDEVQRREVAGLVRLTLDRLPPHYGNALEWKYLEDLPVVEIARRLGLGLKAAESVLTRARAAFREAFRALYGRAGEVGVLDAGR